MLKNQKWAYLDVCTVTVEWGFFGQQILLTIQEKEILSDTFGV